jgi:Uma2 family endonuclease
MILAPDTSGERHWTVADYMELDDERRFEVLEGKLVMVPSPNIVHQRAITRLGSVLDAHVIEHELGECFHAPFDVVLAEDTVVQPDFTYVSRARIAELYDGHCITGAPDLVVEVLSASTESRDRHTKRPLYAEAGVPWLLFVEPEARVVEVLRLNEDRKYVVEDTAAGDEMLEFELFPELSIDLSKVWFTPPEPEGE